MSNILITRQNYNKVLQKQVQKNIARKKMVDEKHQRIETTYNLSVPEIDNVNVNISFSNFQFQFNHFLSYQYKDCLYEAYLDPIRHKKIKVFLNEYKVTSLKTNQTRTYTKFAKHFINTLNDIEDQVRLHTKSFIHSHINTFLPLQVWMLNYFINIENEILTIIQAENPSIGSVSTYDWQDKKLNLSETADWALFLQDYLDEQTNLKQFYLDLISTTDGINLDFISSTNRFISKVPFNIKGETEQQGNDVSLNIRLSDIARSKIKELLNLFDDVSYLENKFLVFEEEADELMEYMEAIGKGDMNKLIEFNQAIASGKTF